jgi:hypothetical protein
MKALTIVDIFWHECLHGTERSAAVMYSMIIASYGPRYGYGLNEEWSKVHTQALEKLKDNYPENNPGEVLQKIKNIAWEIHESLCKGPENAVAH